MRLPSLLALSVVAGSIAAPAVAVQQANPAQALSLDSAPPQSTAGQVVSSDPKARKGKKHHKAGDLAGERSRTAIQAAQTGATHAGVLGTGVSAGVVGGIIGGGALIGAAASSGGSSSS